jgi:Rps23 Pro-64 3,4-dihydroxylase Tpa1-like proline 4-hydroxylase
MVLQPYDRDALKREFDSAVPYRHLLIESFLEPDFAAEVAAAYPTFEAARRQGFEFDAVNERRKIQISDAAKFPAPVARLNEVLASPQFLTDLEYITGIPALEADPTLGGAGMHVTGPHGRLDVHVDFNYVEERERHRRLNILVYLNPGWNAAWGGAIELWDRKVKQCHRKVTPLLNRCVLFETSAISFHGVEPLVGPPDVVRKSFAAYYYTKEAPAGWDGTKHSTIFQARPDERFRRYVLMPAERLKYEGRAALRALKRSVMGGGS